MTSTGNSHASDTVSGIEDTGNPLGTCDGAYWVKGTGNPCISCDEHSVVEGTGNQSFFGLTTPTTYYFPPITLASGHIITSYLALSLSLVSVT